MSDTQPNDPLHAGPAERFQFERGWRHNPLVWIAMVVAMFIAVPLLASWSSERRAAAVARPQPASAAGAAAALAPASGPLPALPPTAIKPQAEPSRQMVTKCVERGRVIYTQTGECNGSVTVVPIDADKNVVDSNAAVDRAPERSR